MKKIITAFAVVSVMLMPVFAGAASFRAGENYNLAKDEVIDGNFYAAGANLLFAGEVKGDLVSAGGNLTLKGSVAKDILLAGGTIVLDGAVGDDARIAGGTVTISGAVKGDVAIAGGNLHLLSGSSVGGDLIIAGGSVIVDGDVAHDVHVVGGNLTLNGAVGGMVESKAEHLQLGPTAVIAGDVVNNGTSEAVVDPLAVVKGKVVNNLITTEPRSFRHFIAAAGVMGFFMLLLAGLVCYWLFKNRSSQLVSHALAHFGKEFLRGILLIILLPILFIILCVTVVGAPIGIMGILFYVVMLILAKVFSGIMLGGWINRVIFKKPEQVFTLQTVIGGNVVMLLLKMVPVLGGAFSFVFTVLAFGAFWGYLYRHFWMNR